MSGDLDAGRETRRRMEAAQRKSDARDFAAALGCLALSAALIVAVALGALFVVVRVIAAAWGAA